MIKFVLCFLLFNSLFIYKIPSIRDSTTLVFLLLALILYLKRDILAFSYNIFNYSIVIRYLYLTLVILSLTTFALLFHGINDLTYLFPRVLQIYYLVMILPLIYYFVYNRVQEKNLIEFFIVCFFIQSIIQFMAQLSPQFYEVVSYFQANSSVKLGSGLTEIRGKALSGFLYFQLAASYGLCLIFSVFYYIRYHRENILFHLIFSTVFIVILIGGLMIGRTVIVALFFCIIIYFLLPNAEFSFRTRFKVAAIFSFSIVFILMLIYFYIPNGFVQNFFHFAFEMIFNFIDNKSLSTRSTDHLMKMLSVDLGTYKELFFGQGFYTGWDTRYFMYTDSGYFRSILFFGLIGTLFKLGCFIYFIVSCCLTSKNYSSRILFIVIGFYLLILEIKGEVIFHNYTMMMMILIYSAILIDKSTNNEM